jgi:hypothetical protein
MYQHPLITTNSPNNFFTNSHILELFMSKKSNAR